MTKPRTDRDFDAPKGDVLNLKRSVIVAFIDEAIKRNERGAPFALLPHQRTVLELAFAFDEQGKLPWDTVIYSCIKKSGKTTINGAVTLAWAFTQEPPNELFILANKEEQAKDRVYNTITKLIRYNRLEAGVRGGVRGLGIGGFELTTDTSVQVVASKAATAAGSNHGYTSWDELWGYQSEAMLLLWEEMTPVATRRNSIRFITTYAGWENESKLLWGLYQQVVSPEEHPEGQGERLHPTLPIFANREARVFCYWDHDPRMPWQTPAYYAGQRRTLRPATFLRLHENRWTSAQTEFVKAEMWDALINPQRHPALRDPGYPVIIGCDAATKKDTAGIVAVGFDPKAQKVVIVNHRAWRPTKEEAIDLEKTMEDEITAWGQRYQVERVVYDPYQFQVIANHLRDAGFTVEEFPQTTDRLTAMGQVLWDLIRGRNLETYPSEELREHALNAVAVETPRGFRIAKEKAKNKIDLFIALAMAAKRLLDDPGSGISQVFIVNAAAESDEAVGPEVTPEARETAAEDARRKQEELAVREAKELWRRAEAWR